MTEARNTRQQLRGDACQLKCFPFELPAGESRTPSDVAYAWTLRGFGEMVQGLADSIRRWNLRQPLQEKLIQQFDALIKGIRVAETLVEIRHGNP